MKYVFVTESWEDYLYWQSNDKIILRRIIQLLNSIALDPYAGAGNPEPLRHKYKDFWSRRLNEKHRLIYQVRQDAILIAKCRFHYDKEK